MRASQERPSAPRCPGCGRFMQVAADGGRLVEYECCGETAVRFRPQFERPPERM